MNSLKPIKFILVGCGHIGKRHIETILKQESAVLAGICDNDSAVLKSLENYNVPLYDDLKNMLEHNQDADVLSIATPNGLHAENAILGLEYGKNILIEKPMALKSSECKEIIDLAHKKAKKVFCVMQNRYSPPAVLLKEIIDKQIAGDIFMVHINCFWNRDERYYTGNNWRGKIGLDGGTLFTQFSHFVDMLFWLFGKSQIQDAAFEDFKHRNLTEFEDSGIIRFKLEKGGIGSFNYSTAVWNNNFESSLTLIAEKGSIKIGGQYMNRLEYCHIKDFNAPDLEDTESANDYGLYKGSAFNHHHIYNNVVKTLNKLEDVEIKPEEGMFVVEWIENAYKLNHHLKRENENK